MLSQGELYSHDGPRPLLQYSVNNHTAIWGNINPESDCFHHKFRLDIQESKPLLLKIRLRPKSQLLTFPLQNFFPHYPRSKRSPSVVFHCHRVRDSSAHLFVCLCGLNPHTKRLGALVTSRAGQAVETWIGVDTALHAVYFVADVRYHVTLEMGEMKWAAQTYAKMKSHIQMCRTIGDKARFHTSLTSSQCVPLPRKPAGQGPHSHDPSGELLQSTPPKHGLDRQPSARDLQGRNGSERAKLIFNIPGRDLRGVWPKY